VSRFIKIVSFLPFIILIFSIISIFFNLNLNNWIKQNNDLIFIISLFSSGIILAIYAIIKEKKKGNV